MAGLPMTRASVLVGPPLSASAGSRMALAGGRHEVGCSGGPDASQPRRRYHRAEEVETVVDDGDRYPALRHFRTREDAEMPDTAKGQRHRAVGGESRRLERRELRDTCYW